LILVVAIIYSFDAQRSFEREQREAVIEQTQNTQLEACARGNRLRETLRSILQSSINLNLSNNKLTVEQAATIKEFYGNQIAKLASVDCERAYPKPKA
jgi:hypothetical protein